MEERSGLSVLEFRSRGSERFQPGDVGPPQEPGKVPKRPRDCGAPGHQGTVSCIRATASGGCDQALWSSRDEKLCAL